MSEVSAPGLAPLAGPAHGRTRQRQPLIWRVQLWLSNYLPLALMALLALFTLWLLRQNPLPEGPKQERAPSQLPDYEMQGFELQRFRPDGDLQAEVRGARLRHYPSTDMVEIEGVNLRLQGEDGRWLQAEAARGLGPESGERLSLSGGVRLRRWAPGADPGTAEPEFELRTLSLEAEVGERRLHSDQALQLVAPRLRLQATGFDYHHPSGRLRFRGPSRSELPPRR